ncbi:MAG: GNAT family N-acetyltransferase [Candidatus Omnitrophota bacterium]
MMEIYSETDEEACRDLWERFIRPDQLTDLWDVRECFHRNFDRNLFFVVIKKEKETVGLLPLSFISEKEYYGYFPGEIWNGKTWLEQNRIIVPDKDILRNVIKWLEDGGKRYFLRYLIENEVFKEGDAEIDEIGYYFYPGKIDFDMKNYSGLFSGKSAKKLKKEVDKIYSQGAEIHKGRIEDFDVMVKMNLSRFGADSYFSDKRFTESFRDLRDYLREKGWLRMTTVSINKETAAVDMGCVYKGVYTLLGGGTNALYPGVAKVINLHHIEEACRERYEKVDFLCGDFSWKKLFHLSPNPLYKICGGL